MNIEHSQEMIDFPFRSKEISWLSFNSRVLQEAANPSVPLLERVKFLGIYSNNLDEFFRVRVATLRRLSMLGKQWKALGIPDPGQTLRDVKKIVADHGQIYDRTYHGILEDLEAEGIRLIKEDEVPEDLADYVLDFFLQEVKPYILPIILKKSYSLPHLQDVPMYLAVEMMSSRSERSVQALIQIPTELPRFVVLPKRENETLVMYLDDVIRYGLPSIFVSLPFDHFKAYALKFTRDAEMHVDDDFKESIYEKIAESIKAREVGLPVRANYDASIPQHLLELVLEKLGLEGAESLYPGGRYHNRKDWLTFPNLGGNHWVYPKEEPVVPRGFESAKKSGLFRAIKRGDVLLHIPYHSFSYFIDLIHEAAISPHVKTIQITQYRLAKHSQVAAALKSAAMNGKDVTVVVEPQARFDESANIKWASLYRDYGIRVIIGVPGLKVHAKLLHITRKEGPRINHYCVIGTGNFNENTARIFADHLLFTSNPAICADVAKIFEFFRQTYLPLRLTQLIAAPLHLRNFIKEKISREMKHHWQHQPAGISLKINNLSDLETARLMYDADEAGVPIRLIVRSMYSLKFPEDGKIRAVGIVDRYLEHSRIFIFENAGNPEVFLASSDFLPRNFDSRVEIVFPVLNEDFKRELIEYFDLQWKDNCKARVLDTELTNQIRPREEGEEEIRSQFAMMERVIQRIR